MQYSQKHLKTMVYAKFGGQTECIMGNWKIENCLFQAFVRTAQSQISAPQFSPLSTVPAHLFILHDE